MGDEKVRGVLKNFGLTEKETEVYIFLAKHGVKRSGEIAKGIKTHRAEVYRMLKSLQTKDLIQPTLESPTRFTTVPFETVIDSFIKTKREEAASVESAKRDLLEDWKIISRHEPELQLEKFVVIEGSHKIYPKILRMTKETKQQLSVISTATGLTRADQLGILDAAFNHPLKDKIQFRFLTDLTSQNLNALKTLLKRVPKSGFNFKGRNPDLGLQLSARMVIRDEEEILFFITPRTDTPATEDDVCLWTNCKALVQSFSAVFEDLWSTSTDIKKKMLEIEAGKPTPQMYIISDAETAHKKYHEIMRSAKNEVIMMTSSKGLIACWRGKSLLREWTQRGVSVRIMAPITNENLEAAQQLPKCCEVKHVPIGYFGATIVDGQHLFQFKNPPPEEKELRAMPYFENTVYTNDTEYVRKTEKMLNDIWNSTQVPSPIALKSVIQQTLSSDKTADASILDEYKNEFKRIVGFSYLMEPQQGKITEKEVLDKIANAKRIPARDPKRDTIRIYGTQAIAIIYPPKNLNLPNFMIFVGHSNRQSSFGAANSLSIYMQAKIADNNSYLPVAFATDNPQGYKFRKAMYKIHRTTEVAKLLKKDELKVQAHGNRLFAGWTVPIPLLPPKYILPPGCIMFEGYGKTKSISAEIIGPLNRRLTYEENILDAFVTFMHPSSRYHGPGSDGLLKRDMILTSCPPAE